MQNKEKSKEGAYASLTGFHRAVPIILFAIAIFIALCYFTKDHTGAFGRVVAGFLLGSFSIGGYFIPVLFAVHAFFYASDIQQKRIVSRVIFSVIILIFISAFAHAIYTFNDDLSFSTFSASAVYNDGVLSRGGGFVGAVVACAIVTVIGNIGLIILALTVFSIYITYFFSGEKNPLKKLFGKILYSFVKIGEAIEKRFKRKKTEKKVVKSIKNEEKRRAELKKSAKKTEALMAKEEDLYDDDFFAVDNGMKEFRIKELGINETRRDEDIEKNPTLQEKVFPKSRVNEPAAVPTDEPTHTKRHFTADYGFNPDEIKYSVENGGKDIVIEESKKTDSASNFGTAYSYGLDDSAENVFTKDFDAFDFAANERLASKQSTMGPAPEAQKPQEDTTARVITAEDVEKARRRAEFELRKSALIKQREEEEARKEAERKARESFRPSEVEFDINPDKAPTEPAATQSTVAPEPTPVRTWERVESSPATPAAPMREEYSQSEPTPYVRPEPVKAEMDEPTFQAPPQTPPQFTQERDTASYYAASSPAYTVYDDDEDDAEDDGIVFTGNADEPVVSEYTDSADIEIDEDEEIEIEVDPEDEEGTTFEFGDEIPEDKRNPQIDEYRKMFSIFSEEKKEEPTPVYQSAPAVAEVFEDDEMPEDEDEDELPYAVSNESDEEDEDEPPFEYEPVKPLTASPVPVVRDEPKREKPDYSNYEFPPIDILAKGHEEEDPTIAEEISENGDKLIDALDQFDVRASIKSVDRGPRITRYEIVPARGVRVNKVISLFDDIALNLAAEGIRMEAPIPGKSAIGVEIPNKHPSTVYLRDLLESDEFKNERSKTFACIGKDVTGNPVFGDIAKMPHVLVAGATGMGKSVCINSILISILYKAKPDEVKLIMVDPKTVEFTMYNGIPHLLVPVVTDVKQAAGALMWAIDEMNRRYELLSKHEVRKLDSYNELVRENPSLGEPLPKIIIVIDELNDLMQQVRKPVEGLITNITQKARAAGIHMIIGTQRPSVDVVTGVIKANIPSRVSCKVTSYTDSKTILDQAGAEKLLDKGDMLFAPVGKPKPIRVQGAFVSDGEVEQIMKYLKSTVKGNVYDEQALEEMNRAAAKCNKGKDDDDDSGESSGEEGVGYLNDKQFLEAVDLAIKQGKISTSLIQRKISIGYGKAAKFIDIMEDMGLVSEPNGQKPRDVLVTRDEWHEMLARRSLDD